MGMDVYGKHPTAEVGKYFRNNVWWWHPLWEYCCEVAPALAGKVENGHTNDGDGLGKRDAVKLADALDAEVKAGRTAEYAAKRQQAMDALPDEECNICGGTGKRDDAIGREAREKDPTFSCNKCQGKGTVRPFDTYYPFSLENVQEFVAFLRESGGFEIC